MNETSETHGVSLALYTEKRVYPSVVVPVNTVCDAVTHLKAANLLPHSLSTRGVIDGPTAGTKRLLLESDTTSDKLPADLQSSWEEHEITLDQRAFSMTELLSRFIPAGITIPASFESVGHIAHINIQEDQLPYKEIIAEAILLKNKNIKTVVRKIGIKEPFRQLDLELLAGEPNYETRVKQGNLIFELDYSAVYFNARLVGEHDRLVELFSAGEKVADVMAGIGPFVVRAAVRGCVVWGCDLNPECARWMRRNVKINRVEKLVEVFCEDGRRFIRRIFESGGCDHVVMNLPVIAIEFLDAFRPAMTEFPEARMPIVHVYGFAQRDDDPEETLRARASQAFGGSVGECPVARVRDVSPGKDMFRLDIDLKRLVVAPG